jgi:hypothetical protein
MTRMTRKEMDAGVGLSRLEVHGDLSMLGPGVAMGMEAQALDVEPVAGLLELGGAVAGAHGSHLRRAAFETHIANGKVSSQVGSSYRKTTLTVSSFSASAKAAAVLLEPKAIAPEASADHLRSPP